MVKRTNNNRSHSNINHWKGFPFNGKNKTSPREIVLVDILLLVGLDDDVTSRVRDAGQDVPGFKLTVGLDDGTGNDLPEAGGARPRPARVRQDYAVLLRLVKDVDVFEAF